MGWKNFSTTKKGFFIGLIIGILFYSTLYIYSNLSNNYCSITIAGSSGCHNEIISAIGFFGFFMLIITHYIIILPLIRLGFINSSSNLERIITGIFTILFTILFFGLIGLIIGWVIGKIKSKS
jgi:hypothetical protein